ncbi:Rieske (2Fe-2S) protein [Streptomyces sp. NBC_01525]|uniref:Cytochrome bc1 complex Rieske iron-sulfur subunit n=1 Tax=Streptomyces benahoarensis TaxID=2595054 RepID=A0A553ZRL5_9ACTN|nr:Rieske (2Fe-2S) protein [Streptomyces benahoarensis]TSB32392.1 Rieske (2Fe-2S) protein [Streptomyces benahoarensis]TSB43995.1 Rieske (2Fe-2S) protein [Streptomyces benahoarensis]
MSQPPARRTVLRGAALVGAAGFGVAACSGGSGPDSGVPTEPVELGAAAEVPVGGAKLYREDRLVVSQPSKGTFKCFSATCTHAGCVLTEVTKEEGDCSCHGSRFDVTNGQVLQGPATKPLPEVPIKNKGGKLIAG